MAEIPPVTYKAKVDVDYGPSFEETVRTIVRNELATALETVVTALATQLKGSV